MTGGDSPHPAGAERRTPPRPDQGRQHADEEARVAIRNIRRDAIHDLKELEKEHLISEDDLEVGEKKVQEKTDCMIKRVDELVKDKDAEIMTV